MGSPLLLLLSNNMTPNDGSYVVIKSWNLVTQIIMQWVCKKKKKKTKRKLVEKVAIIGSYIVQLNLDKIEMSK